MYEEFSRQTFVIWQQNMLIAWVDPTRIQVKLSSFPQLRQGTMTAEKKTNDKILHHDNCIWIQNKFITFKIRKKYIFVIEIIKNRKHPFSMLVLIAYLKGKRDKNIYHRVRSLGPVPFFFSIFQGSLMMLWKRKKSIIDVHVQQGLINIPKFSFK